MQKTPIFVAARGLRQAQDYFNKTFDKKAHTLRYVYDRSHLTGLNATVDILDGADKKLIQFCYENEHRIKMVFV